MCFSATASFTASTVLAASGAVTVKESTKQSRFFSLIPFLFSIQQLLEGIQWIMITRGTPSIALGYGFLFFAFLVWPVYMPLSYMMMEKDAWRKKFMAICLGIGIGVMTWLLVEMLTGPLVVRVEGYHIFYDAGVKWPFLLAAIYTLSVCVSGMLSSYFYPRFFSALVFVFAGISAWLYTYQYVSTWCFFAAALSILVIFGVDEQKKRG